MSEQVYAFLLRLYPSHFRSIYGDEALQLVRDRARHEPSLRLWIDLLLDLARSLPELHLRPEPASPRSAGPMLLILEGEAPRPDHLLLGAVASLLLVFAAVPTVQWLARLPAFHPQTGIRMQVGAKSAPQITAAERHVLIQALAADVKRRYFDSKVAEAAAGTLLAHDKAGDYDALTDGRALAGQMARQLIEASRDPHFTVEYTPNAFPDFSKPPAPEFQARYRTAMEQSNCTFEKVEIRPNHVGYVKLNAFPELAACREKAVAAMETLNNAGAVIFDLRANRGGYPNMVVFLAGYLFDHPEYMFSPGAAVDEQCWTRSPVAGSRLAHKPVFILTSSRTYSGAEQFTYDLKMLKRATIVGETTGGANHAGVLRNLVDHFAAGIPEHRPVNPYSDKDWALTGVEPDVKVAASDALETAQKLAETRLGNP